LKEVTTTWSEANVRPGPGDAKYPR